MSADYPHLTITKEQKHCTFECTLLYEVLTKTVAALDDITKGLGEVKVGRVSFLSLLDRYPELQERVFPVDRGVIRAGMNRSQLKYDQNGCSEPLSLLAQMFFEQYTDELEQGDSCSFSILRSQ